MNFMIVCKNLNIIIIIQRAINLQKMIQFEDKKGDIYQILSFCLGHLKRKIVTFIKIHLNQKNLDQRPQLIIQLAKQQRTCKQYINMLRNSQQKLIKKQYETLFQRFIYRVKQLIRNYLPHASVSHQIFVYLKKIQTYSFKPNYILEDYIIHILQDNPQSIQKKIQLQNIQFQRKEINSDGFSQFSQPRKHFSISRKQQHANNNRFTNCSRYQKHLPEQQLFENDKEQSVVIRPIDVFNKSIKSLVDCLDCDISVVRSIYFNLQKQKESLSVKRSIQSPFSGNNKLLKQIQQQMLYQNRFIRQSVKSFDRQFAKLQAKIQKDPQYFRKHKKRCFTAGHPRKQFNFSILSNDQSEKLNERKIKRKAQISNKFQTINNYPTQQQRQQLLKQIQSRKNNILKMKSISISANKGHLQLCAQSKQGQRNKRITLLTNRTSGFNSLKKAIQQNNNNRNVSVNLKKKYDVFLTNNCCAITKQSSNTHKKQKQQIQKSLQLNCQKYQCSIAELKGRNKYPLSKQYDKTADTIEIKYQNYTERYQQSNRKYQTITNDFQVLVKKFMKGTNVNHRNYTTLQSRQKKVFQTLNPQLTVKNFKQK